MKTSGHFNLNGNCKYSDLNISAETKDGHHQLRVDSNCVR